MAFRDGRRQRKSRHDPQAYLGHASRRQDFCGQLPHAISWDRLYRQGAGRLSLGPTQLSTQFVNGTTMLFAPADSSQRPTRSSTAVAVLLSWQRFPSGGERGIWAVRLSAVGSFASSPRRVLITATPPRGIGRIQRPPRKIETRL